MSSDLMQTLATSASGMKAQSTRLRHVAENIANADTPGYRRKTTPFSETFEAGRATGMVQTGRVQLDQGELPTIFDPGHPMADESGYYLGSNVETMVEIADACEAQRS